MTKQVKKLKENLKGGREERKGKQRMRPKEKGEEEKIKKETIEKGLKGVKKREI